MFFLRVITGFISLVTIWFLQTGVGAQSLTHSLVNTYNNNPTLLAARARLRATDEGVPQAISNWRPKITLSGSYGLKRADSTVNGPGSKSADVTVPATGTLQIVQNLYRGGRTTAGIEVAENEVLADRASLGEAEQTVLLSAVIAYADVVRDQAVLKLNKNNEIVLARQLEATQDRFKVGEVTKTDVSLAESRLSLARADKILAEGNLTDARATYKNVVGFLPNTLKPAVALVELPENLGDAVSLAKSKNYNVLQRSFMESSAKNSVRKTEGELLPTISVNGSASAKNETTGDRSQSESVAISVEISMPLYASGSVVSRVREAKQLASQRRDEHKQSVRDAIEEVTGAWQSLKTRKAQLNAFSDAVKASEIALQGVKEEANVGSRTVLDVLDAEQELLNARVSLVRVKRDELVARFEVKKAIGELTAEKLNLPVKLYNVKKYYKNVRKKWWGLTIN